METAGHGIRLYNGDVPRILCRHNADQDIDTQLNSNGRIQYPVQLDTDFR